MSTTELALHNPAQSGVLQRIGSPEERQYLLQVMAEQLGIPAADATRTDVVALLAAAAQRTLQFGWVPGIHLHVQKFETDRSKKAREKDPSARVIYSYTLVDGEKAWKDSGTRWRDRGYQWRYQRRPMTTVEVKEEARLQGFNESLAPNAYGMWSRIIVAGQDDPNDPDNPIWSAGVYTGKIKAGNFWRADQIPTGASSRDVAIRRADKRAMMQSMLTLIPIDDLSVDARVQQLTDNLRREAAGRQRMEEPMQRLTQVEVEDDGDVLWAKTTPAARVLPPDARIDEPASPRFEEEDFGMGEDDVHAEPSDEDDAPVEFDARINNSDGPCPECRAPVGKLHGSACPLSKGAAPAARIEEPVARVQQPDARVEAEPQSTAFSDRIFAECATVTDGWKMAHETAELVRRVRNSDHDSAMKMSDKYLDALVAMIGGALKIEDKHEVYYLLTALVGKEVSAKHKPGQFVHSHLIKLLRVDDAKAIAALQDVLEACRTVAVAAIEGTGPNG